MVLKLSPGICQWLPPDSSSAATHPITSRFHRPGPQPGSPVVVDNTTPNKKDPSDYIGTVTVENCKGALVRNNYIHSAILRVNYHCIDAVGSVVCG